MHTFGQRDHLVLQASEDAKKRFYSRLEKVGDCLLFTGCKVHGYGAVRIHGSVYLTHRVAILWHINAPHPGLVVRHSCRNRSCCNPKHLCFGTTAENNRDRIRDKTSGIVPYGEISKSSRINDEIAFDICVRYFEKRMSPRSIANALNRGMGTVNSVVYGKNWLHVSEPFLRNKAPGFYLYPRGRSLLSRAQVFLIMDLIMKGHTNAQICRAVPDCKASTVSRIKSGLTYRVWREENPDFLRWLEGRSD